MARPYRDCAAAWSALAADRRADGVPPRGRASIDQGSPHQRHRPRGRPPRRTNCPRSHARSPCRRGIRAGPAESGRCRSSLSTWRSDHRRARTRSHRRPGEVVARQWTHHRSAWYNAGVWSRLTRASRTDDGTAAIVRRPTLVGALPGKATAVAEIVSLSSAERAKHLRDVDALARLFGPTDRAGTRLTARERSIVSRVAEHSDISPLATRSIHLMTAPSLDE